MYFFGFGGDIPAFFGRYRVGLRTRADIAGTSGLSEADIERRARALPGSLARYVRVTPSSMAQRTRHDVPATFGALDHVASRCASQPSSASGRSTAIGKPTLFRDPADAAAAHVRIGDLGGIHDVEWVLRSRIRGDLVEDVRELRLRTRPG